MLLQLPVVAGRQENLVQRLRRTVVDNRAPNGSRLKRVFKDRHGRYAMTPTWSPNGSMIAFALDPTQDQCAHPPNGLYIIRSHGRGLTKILGENNFKRETVWVSG